MRWLLLAWLTMASCREDRPTTPTTRTPSARTATPTPPTPSATRRECTADEFAEGIDLAEASGAVWVEASFGLPAHLVVTGDSGTRGAFVVVDEAGALLARGALPLDRGATDDLEGLARIGDVYYAITSGGQMRQWRRTAAARFELTEEAYAIDASLACRGVNCGHNFEGLCLAAPGDGCDGYAASKDEGTLVCLEVDAGGRVRADPARTIRAAIPEVLTGCDIAPEGDLLYTGANLFGGNSVARWSGWRDPATARAEELGRQGPGFCEAIAVGPGGAVYRLSDLGGAPSLSAKVSCPPPPR